LQEIGREILALSRAGLARRARKTAQGADETHHLDVLDARIDSGKVAADELVAKFKGEWNGSVMPAFAACRI
jgi:glutamate--cysteine ligase